jgi:hypothetical protein
MAAHVVYLDRPAGADVRLDELWKGHGVRSG